MIYETFDKFDPQDTLRDPIYNDCKRTQSHFNTLMNSLNVSVFILKDWKIQWCNGYSEKMFDRIIIDLIGSPFEAFFESHDDFERTISDFYTRDEDATYQPFKLNLYRKDGELLQVELILTQIMHEDEYTGELMIIIRDISEFVMEKDNFKVETT